MAGATKATREYEAARRGAAVATRPGRHFLEVTGRAPGEMLKGILTGGLPGELLGAGVSGAGMEALSGEVVYSAMLTAKGRMITDLRVLRGAEGGFLLDLPESGLQGALAHFGKYLPPRLASLQDRSGDLAMFTVLGPDSVPVLAEGCWGESFPPSLVEDVQALAEGREVVLRGVAAGEVRVVRNGDVLAPAWDVLLPRADADGLLRRLVEEGALPLSLDTWEILRVERGRPAFGVDMDEKTIPVEAGIHLRAIDFKKGCYTGQEVIVRIRDRGKLNRHLRRLLLGDALPPARGESLFVPGRQKSVGWVTSACSSPAFGETLALGYLRREVEPGGEVRVGGVDGPAARVQVLDDEGAG
jgi:tRNA-modifying protein YgfZ